MSEATVNNTPPHIAPDAIENRAIDIAWPDPQPIGTPPAPEFPVDVLPAALRDWVTEESVATQTPPAMAALLSLSVCAAVLAKRIEVEAWSGYVEPVNLYAAVILDPANRKSAVFSAATKPIRELEQSIQQEEGPQLASMRSERRQLEKRLSKLEKMAAESKDATTRENSSVEAIKLAKQLEGMPESSETTLLIDDATSERIPMLMQVNGERLASMSAEGGVFDLMAGKYAKSGGTDMEVYLKGHSGDAIRVERVGRPPIRLDAPCLTMGLAIQPEVVRGLAGQNAFRGRGLLGRFLYAVPQSWIGRREIGSPPVSEPVKLAFHTIVKDLAKLKPGKESMPNRIPLDPEACELFKLFCRWIENELGAGELEFMRDWGGKLAGLTLRIAGILHCVRHGLSASLSTPISGETIVSAEKIARWAIPHAEMALSLLTAADVSEVRDDALYLLRWIEDQFGVNTTFAKRDAYRHGHRRFNRFPDRLDCALRLLEESHYIRKETSSLPGGRVTFKTSPKLMGESAIRGANGADHRSDPMAPAELAPLAPASNCPQSELVKVTI